MTPTDLDKLKALSATWRGEADYCDTGATHALAMNLPVMVSLSTVIAQAKRECADNLDALIAELEKGQA